MSNFIVVLIIILALFFAIRSIAKAKKKGKSCSSCPNNGTCSGKC